MIEVDRSFIVSLCLQFTPTHFILYELNIYLILFILILKIKVPLINNIPMSEVYMTYPAPPPPPPLGAYTTRLLPNPSALCVLVGTVKAWYMI